MTAPATPRDFPAVPDRMKRFKLWKGRYPIHYTVFCLPDGTPQFKVVSRPRQIECIKKNLCHLCGQRLNTGRYYFIGGPDTMRHRHFIDGPMHQECGEFAARACPFLANPHATYREIDNPNLTNVVQIAENNTQVGEPRPARMCLAWSKTCREEYDGKQYPVFIAGPWEGMDWDIMPPRVETPAVAGSTAEGG